MEEEIKNRIIAYKKANVDATNQQIKEALNLKNDPTSIGKFLKQERITTKDLTGLRYRKYSVDDNYFNKIDSHEKAYLLGVWYSDGYLVIEGDGTKRVGLDTKDVDWMQNILKELKSNSPLYKTEKENIKRIKITSPIMYEDLIRLGCFENKTFKLRFPTPEQVPSKFLNSFILGLTDGDGSIYLHDRELQRKGKNNLGEKYFYREYGWSITGTEDLLTGVRKFLGLEQVHLQERWPERHTNNRSLSVHGVNNVAKIVSQLYTHAPSFCLKRKYDNYRIIMEDSRVKL